jgi:diadenosine tetraphosphatase ApaH/serine/threonine PP2A family protein phosphatase
MGIEDFNPVAAAAAEWTARTIDDDTRGFLAGLPLVRVEGAFTLVHGSLRDPVWEYLLSAAQAEAHLERQTTPYGFIGHSHVPLVAEERDGRVAGPMRAGEGTTVTLGERRLVLNPGGAGQPRDGDPRASYILYDDAAATISWRRVEYDIAAAQRRILDAGLPPFLAERLAVGR